MFLIDINKRFPPICNVKTTCTSMYVIIPGRLSSLFNCWFEIAHNSTGVFLQNCHTKL